VLNDGAVSTDPAKKHRKINQCDSKHDAKIKPTYGMYLIIMSYQINHLKTYNLNLQKNLNQMD